MGGACIHSNDYPTTLHRSRAESKIRMAKEIRFAPSFVSSYRDYEAEAHELVKKLIRSSLEKIAAEQAQQESTELMSWPLGKDFTIEKGLEAIDKFVKVNIIYADY